MIFEVMNNRGRDLSDLDLVKNYILYLGTKLAVPDEGLHGEVAHTWKQIFENLMNAGLDGTSHEDQLLRSHWLMAYDYVPKRWEGSRSIKGRFNLRSYEGRHEALLDDLKSYVRTLAQSSIAYCDAHRPTRAGSFGDFDQDGSPRLAVIISDCLVRMNVLAAFRPLLIAARLKYPGMRMLTCGL